MLKRTPAIDPDLRLETGTLEIAPRPPHALWLIALWPTKALAKEAEAMDFPLSPGAMRQSAGRTVMHIALGRWLVEAELSNVPPDLDPEIGTVADLSQARCSVTVRGTQSVDLVQKITPIDLSLDRHGQGNAFQTGSGHSIAFAAARLAEDHFVLYVDRSYGADFWETLMAEAAEFVPS